MSSKTGLALAFFLVPGLAAAGAALSGSFRAEPYGTLELTTEGEHVVGRVLEGGPCRFDAQREVLVGDFEGSVLVAQLTVCQSGGDMCPREQNYTVLGIYNEADNTLVANVRLRDGCQSAALQKGRFVMSPAVKEVPAPDEASPRRGPRGASSSEVNTDAAKQAAELGKQLYQQRNFADAVKKFDQSLTYDPGDSNWPAYLGRGSTLLKMGQVKAAISDLEHSRSANAATSSKRDPNILYMLGCAYGQKGDKKQALEYLRNAVRLGYPLHEYIEGDPDLTRALGDEPQFKELVRKSRERKARGPAGSSGSASP